MLLLTKTQKGLSDSQISQIDTHSLIINLVDYYEMIAEDRGIVIEMRGEFGAVLGDKSMLQRLFANLISNAVHYAAKDSRIAITAQRIALSEIVGKESGIQQAIQTALRVVIINQLDEPLTQSEADKLFERFYRHHKTIDRHTGTGLGLSIVQSIVGAHNGNVSITIKDDDYFQVSVELLADV